MARFVLGWAGSRIVNRAGDWLKQAERDLLVATTDASAGFHEWAAFAAQQGAEKAVKGLIQALRGSVRGHAITEMLRQLPSSVEIPATLLKSAQELDKVYVTARYPNGFASGSPGDYFSEDSSRELITHARTIMDWCRSQIH